MRRFGKTPVGSARRMTGRTLALVTNGQLVGSACVLWERSGRETTGVSNGFILRIFKGGSLNLMDGYEQRDDSSYTRYRDAREEKCHGRPSAPLVVSVIDVLVQAD